MYARAVCILPPAGNLAFFQSVSVCDEALVIFWPYARTAGWSRQVAGEPPSRWSRQVQTLSPTASSQHGEVEVGAAAHFDPSMPC